MGDILDVLLIQHLSATEGLGVGINAWPPGDGETSFLDSRPKSDFESGSSQHYWGRRNNGSVRVECPDLLKEVLIMTSFSLYASLV